ncbi:unnamed protein product [Microthlaspi erraticum]|uniref:CHY-type domain-containing protein n=1 Tax=Microthlaspi erraticum TaxID=1685480 RepID=A0A6D2L7N9_9BRAS|nr:unnamed protein product [Microthlaspi erraticum]
MFQLHVLCFESLNDKDEIVSMHCFQFQAFIREKETKEGLRKKGEKLEKKDHLDYKIPNFFDLGIVINIDKKLRVNLLRNSIVLFGLTLFLDCRTHQKVLHRLTRMRICGLIFAVRHGKWRLDQESVNLMEIGSGHYRFSHYRRRCKIRAPCCDGLFDC